MAAITHAIPVVNWSLVTKRCFGVLLLAYPGISQTLFMMFKCQYVDGVPYLLADMTLQCFTGRWLTFASYAAVMIAVYVVGLPLTVFLILYKRRHKLHGDNSKITKENWGFLYDMYGPTAVYWEVEEILRRLMLISVVVFFSWGTVGREAVAVTVCTVAHVIHSNFTPWGSGSIIYALQHYALTTVTLVFLSGLLFKVGAVQSGSAFYYGLEIILTIMCGLFLLLWLYVIGLALYRACRSKAFSSSHVVASVSDWGDGRAKIAVTVGNSRPVSAPGFVQSRSRASDTSVSNPLYEFRRTIQSSQAKM
jgi:hypothetical protein